MTTQPAYSDKTPVQMTGSRSELAQADGANTASAHYDMHNDIKEVFFTEQQIQKRVAELGDALTQEFQSVADKGETIVLVSVLRGAAIFMADLARYMNVPLEMDYMAISSYGSGTKSSGVVRILKDLSSEIKCKHVDAYVFAEESCFARASVAFGGAFVAQKSKGTSTHRLFARWF